MNIRGGQVNALVVLAVLAFAAAGWSWWNAWSAVGPLQTLEVQVTMLREETNRLAALPDVPDLPSLTDTLRSFLGSLEPGLRTKFGAPRDSGLSVVSGIPDVPGVRTALLEVTDPSPAVGLPQESLARVARWQRRWPLAIREAVWNGKDLTATLTVYGR